MSASSTPAKVCLICGLDVADKPRVKDAQGRYTCKECLDRAQKAKQAQQQAKSPAARGPNAETGVASEGAVDNSFLLDLGKPALKEGQQPCPNCAKPMAQEAKICVNCGMNLQTGQRMHVQVMKAPADKKAKK